MNRLKGVAAAAAALAVTELVSGLLGFPRSPVVGIGDAVIEATPGPVAETIIGIVGSADKPLAIVCVVAAILGLGALVGGSWTRRPRLAVGGLVLVTAAGMAVVAVRPDTSPMQILICALGGVVAFAVLQALSGARAESADRRKMLRTTGIVIAGSALVAVFGRVLGQARAGVETARAGLRLPLRTVNVPAGVDLGLGEPWNTPVSDFYRIDTALSPPLIEPADWSLRIHGMVERELVISYRDLIDRGLVDAWITLCCVSNEVGGDLIGNGAFSGVPMKDLLEEAGIRDGADALLSTSQDGWTCGTPLDILLDGRNALLAIAHGGEPLTVEHGFPVRQVVPGVYGYVSATKWVVDWEVTRFADAQAYWTQRGWAERGPIKVQSRIDVPSGNVERGAVTVAGVAWAQHRGIDTVEVRAGEGAWSEARLAPAPNNDTWVQWVWDWDAEPGDYRLEVRATDSDGTVQSARRVDPIPDGAEGYDGVFVTVT